MKLKTYNLPAYYASALVNNDYSGLDNSDIELLNKWLTGMAKAFPVFYCINAEVEHAFFSHTNVINHLGCDLCAFTFDTQS